MIYDRNQPHSLNVESLAGLLERDIPRLNILALTILEVPNDLEHLLIANQNH